MMKTAHSEETRRKISTAMKLAHAEGRRSYDLQRLRASEAMKKRWEDKKIIQNIEKNWEKRLERYPITEGYYAYEDFGSYIIIKKHNLRINKKDYSNFRKIVKEFLKKC